MSSFTYIRYDDNGDCLGRGLVDAERLDNDSLNWFEQRLSRLSGDLELPLESKVPGEFRHLDFRIVSDLHAAYVLYYHHDEGVFASLLLCGENEAAENELAAAFKFLLLDTDDIDEPDKDEIEQVVNAKAFDFFSVSDRPAVFSVRFSQRPDETEVLNYIETMDQHLAAAFFAR